jgi:hypothetical protein
MGRIVGLQSRPSSIFIFFIAGIPYGLARVMQSRIAPTRFPKVPLLARTHLINGMVAIAEYGFDR